MNNNIKFNVMKNILVFLFIISFRCAPTFANVVPYTKSINIENKLKVVKFKGLRLQCPEEYIIKKDDSNYACQISGEISQNNLIRLFTIDYLDGNFDLNILSNKYIEQYEQYPGIEIGQKYNKVINSVDYKAVTIKIPAESIEGVFYFFKKGNKTIAFVFMSNVKGLYKSEETLSILKSINTYNIGLCESNNYSGFDYENDIERWSKSSSSYSNFKYGFCWRFDPKYEFDKRLVKPSTLFSELRHPFQTLSHL